MSWSGERLKSQQLDELAQDIDAHKGWWRFPKQDKIKGFFGTGSVFFVGDQPSTSEWPDSHPNRKAYYETILKVGMENAHLTDLYKKRGKANELKNGLPRDFHDHLCIFRREIEILQPTRIIAVGNLAYRLLCEHTADLQPRLRRIWHFSYVGTHHRDKLPLYESNMRKALQFIHK